MNKQLIFIHGRAQENKEPGALKAEWIEALNEGLAKNGLVLPISDSDIRFPFYGNTLYDLVSGKSASEASAIIVRGHDSSDADEARFIQSVVEEVRRKAGISEEQIAAIVGETIVRRGPLNWGWVQGVLQAVDRWVPHGSGGSIALATKDVYKYLKDPGIRQIVDAGIASAITPGVETVIVSHSLGTVAAYNVLRQSDATREFNVSLFVTLGSPLAVTEVRKTVKSLAAPTQCPACVTAWFNAMDDRDVVALYPLTPSNFPLDPANPAITNKVDVKNKTENRHGISGYLDDKEVARRIYDALIA